MIKDVAAAKKVLARAMMRDAALGRVSATDAVAAFADAGFEESKHKRDHGKFAKNESHVNSTLEKVGVKRSSGQTTYHAHGGGMHVEPAKKLRLETEMHIQQRGFKAAGVPEGSVKRYRHPETGVEAVHKHSKEGGRVTYHVPAQKD